MPQAIAREAIERSVEWIRGARAPGYSTNPEAPYAALARSAFDEIVELRAEGFSTETLCAGFAANGLLPVNAKPNSLRAAFTRERKRRETLARPQKTRRPEANEKGKASPASAAERPKSATRRENGEASANDRVREMTGKVIDTSDGETRRRYSDGGFDV
jgi:hypothetical protein